MMPNGRQWASGLSLLLSATRSRCSSAPQGVNGRPSWKDEPRFQNGLRRAAARKSSLDAAAPAGRVFRDAASTAPTGRETSQMPLRSGLPSAVLGVGALRFGFPSAVRGTPGVGYEGHWAISAEGIKAITMASAAVIRASYHSTGLPGSNSQTSVPDPA